MDPGAGGTGGTGAVGGGAGTGAGGMATASGGMASGGMASGGMASGGTAPITTGPLPNVGCDYQIIISKSCSIAGCHRQLEQAGGLNLAVDDGFRSRLVDVPTKHIQIDCDPGAGYVECVPPPATCPPPGTAKLVNRAAPAESWVLKKLDGGYSCGDAMPFAPGDSPDTGWGPAAKACLQTFFTALANNQ
jgi:hypothetical protein